MCCGVTTVMAQNGWDVYIDTLIKYSDVSNTVKPTIKLKTSSHISLDDDDLPHIDSACIVALDNGAMCTSTTHPKALKIRTEEAIKISMIFRAKNLNWFGSNGLYVLGKKYQLLRADEEARAVFAKKKGAGHVVAQASETAIIIAHCPEGKQPGRANDAAAKIVSHLSNYSR